MPTGKPQITAYCPNPTEDLQIANKQYADSLSKLQLIEIYLPTGTASTKTFSFPAIDWELVSQLILVIDINVSGVLDLEMKYNANVTNYFDDGTLTSGGATAFIDNGAIAHNEIISTLLLSGGGAHAAGQVIIMNRKHATVERLTAISNFMGGALQFSQVGHLNTNDNDPLTSIIIETSASTWTADTRMTLYRLLR